MNSTSYIMIVDDNEMNREMLKLILSSNFSNLLLAGSGQEALSVLANNHVDLILMDLEMPVMDGFQTTERIRSIEAVQGGHIPVVALTAHGMQDSIEQCNKVGMDAFISKPFNPLEIVAVITRLLPCRTDCSHAGSDVLQAEQTPHASGPEDDLKMVFNLSELTSRAGNNKEHIASYVALFMEEIEQDLPILENAILTEDSTMVARLIHSIKGISCNIGAERMCSVGDELNTAANNGDFFALRAKAELLLAEYTLFKKESRAAASASQ